jgi:fibronectin type 3 domain-containing protein
VRVKTGSDPVASIRINGNEIYFSSKEKFPSTNFDNLFNLFFHINSRVSNSIYAPAIYVAFGGFVTTLDFLANKKLEDVPFLQSFFDNEYYLVFSINKDDIDHAAKQLAVSGLEKEFYEVVETGYVI